MSTDLQLKLLLDPASIGPACGYTLDAWQAEALNSTSPRLALLVSRQAGKSFSGSLLAIRELLTNPKAVVLLVSATQRQSGLLFNSCLRRYNELNRPIPARKITALTLELANGARLISLPGSSDSIRGYSAVTLLLFDEAAYCDDELFIATRPMLATSKGRTVLLSTPNGMAGFFYECCTCGDYAVIQVPATEVSRIPTEFLEQERHAMAPEAFAQEYMAQFEDASYAMFSRELLDRASSDYELWEVPA